MGVYTIKSACARITTRGFDIKRPKGSGRKFTAINSPNIRKVREHLDNPDLPDEEKSLEKVSRSLHLPRTTTQRIIKGRLKKKSLTKIKAQYVRKINAKKRLDVCT